MSISIIGSVVWLITTTLGAIGLTGVFALMTVESFGIPPLPSEVILTFSGFLIAEGTFSLYGTIFAALAGSLVGSFIAYGVGRWGREWITRPRPAGLRLSPEQVGRVDRWFQRRGDWVVAVARMLPIVRSYISYPAGFGEMNPTKFGVYTLLGSIPFTLALIYAGIVLRADWSAITPWFNLLDYVVIAAIVVIVIYALLAWKRYVSWDWPPRRLPRASRMRPPV